jgi:O-antigen/teichoic acid export membrane protein
VLTFKFVNLRGDLFATAFCFALQAVIKLGSSVILTRILRPEAFGIMAILMSIVFVVEMMSDIGITVPVIRSKNGEEPHYLNTAWTLRLGRSLLNSAILFVFAPMISGLYGAPTLTVPLRVFSIWFVLNGLESMSFPVAIRRKQSRIIVYSELISTFIATAFSLVYCHYSRDYWGMVYATLLSRLLMVVMSYQFYREIKLKLQVDWSAARELLRYSRFAMPSGILTLILSQFDKIAFLRLFNLHLLGIYGLAANIAAPIESLITKISQLVLYPRCAHNFRLDQDTVSLKYYTENTRLFISILIVPAIVGGAAHLIISLLYDSRYAQAAPVLQAFMVRAALLSLASPAEELLIAAGTWHVILVGNVVRAISLISASLIGYHFFGFMGFTYGAALSGLPPLIYYLWLQEQKGMLIAKYELYRLVFVFGIATSAYLTSSLVLALWPGVRIRN